MRKLIAMAAVLVVFWASCADSSTDSSAEAEVVGATATSEPPSDCLLSDFPTFDPTNTNFLTADNPNLVSDDGLNCYSWQTFIALNWPADPNNRGEPDRSQGVSAFGTLGTGTPAVWETFKAAPDVFTTDGSAPAGWDTQVPLPSACQDAGAAAGAKTMSDQSKFSGDQVLPEEIEASGGWLTAQNRTIVHFERRLNEDEFNYIVGKQLYNADQQYTVATDTSGAGISLPFGSTGYGGLGAIEIKAAWRQLDANDPNNARYWQADAYLLDEKAGTCTQALVGLVGLHIIHKTPSFRNFVWSTFEQVDNAPDHGATSTPAVPWSFNDPTCQVNGQPCPPNVQPKGDTPTTVPIQADRTDPIPADVASLNEFVQAKIAKENSSSVWQYYQLVNTLWSDSGTNVFTGPNKQAPVSVQMRQTGNVTVANLTMETYTQGTPNQPLNCTDFHSKSTIASSASSGPNTKLFGDFSFLLSTACPNPANSRCT